MKGHPPLGTSYNELPKDAEPSCQPSTLPPYPVFEVPKQESPEPWMQPCGSPLEPCVLWESCRDSQWRRCAACVSKDYGDKGCRGNVLYWEHGGWTGKHGETHWLQLKRSCAAPAPVRCVPRMEESSGVMTGSCAPPLPNKESVEPPRSLQQSGNNDLALGAQRRDTSGK